MPLAATNIPDSLIEIMKLISKEVLKNNPEDINKFASVYFEKLVTERDGTLHKGYENFLLYEKYFKGKEKFDFSLSKPLGNNKWNSNRTVTHIGTQVLKSFNFASLNSERLHVIEEEDLETQTRKGSFHIEQKQECLTNATKNYSSDQIAEYENTIKFVNSNSDNPNTLTKIIEADPNNNYAGENLTDMSLKKINISIDNYDSKNDIKNDLKDLTKNTMNVINHQTEKAENNKVINLEFSETVKNLKETRTHNRNQSLSQAFLGHKSEQLNNNQNPNETINGVNQETINSSSSSYKNGLLEADIKEYRDPVIRSLVSEERVSSSNNNILLTSDLEQCVSKENTEVLEANGINNVAANASTTFLDAEEFDVISLNKKCALPIEEHSDFNSSNITEVKNFILVNTDKNDRNSFECSSVETIISNNKTTNNELLASTSSKNLNFGENLKSNNIISFTDNLVLSEDDSKEFLAERLTSPTIDNEFGIDRKSSRNASYILNDRDKIFDTKNDILKREYNMIVNKSLIKDSSSNNSKEGPALIVENKRINVLNPDASDSNSMEQLLLITPGKELESSIDNTNGNKALAVHVISSNIHKGNSNQSIIFSQTDSADTSIVSCDDDKNVLIQDQQSKTELENLSYDIKILTDEGVTILENATKKSNLEPTKEPDASKNFGPSNLASNKKNEKFQGGQNYINGESWDEQVENGKIYSLINENVIINSEKPTTLQNLDNPNKTNSDTMEIDYLEDKSSKANVPFEQNTAQANLVENHKLIESMDNGLYSIKEDIPIKQSCDAGSNIAIDSKQSTTAKLQTVTGYSMMTKSTEILENCSKIESLKLSKEDPQSDNDDDLKELVLESKQQKQELEQLNFNIELLPENKKDVINYENSSNPIFLCNNHDDVNSIVTENKFLPQHESEISNFNSAIKKIDNNLQQNLELTTNYENKLNNLHFEKDMNESTVFKIEEPTKLAFHNFGQEKTDHHEGMESNGLDENGSNLDIGLPNSDRMQKNQIQETEINIVKSPLFYDSLESETKLSDSKEVPFEHFIAITNEELNPELNYTAGFSDSKETESAVLIQKTYRGYRIRRGVANTANTEQSLPKELLKDSKNQKLDDSEIENMDISHYDPSSLEAMYYSLKKNDILLDKMKKQASVCKSADKMKSFAYQHTINNTNQMKQSDENNEKNNFESRDLNNLSGRSNDSKKNFISPSIFDDDIANKIKNNILVSSVSEGNSDTLENTNELINAIVDDKYISTAYESYTTSDEIDSSITTAVTRIQAGARGFLVRQRFRRATIIETPSSAAYAYQTFGNYAELSLSDDNNSGKPISCSADQPNKTTLSANIESLARIKKRRLLQRTEAVHESSSQETNEKNLPYLPTIDCGKNDLVRRHIGPRQKSLPLQIDSLIIRVVPKHMRKRVKSANVSKESKSF